MLTQAEADMLIATVKEFVAPNPIFLRPGLDESLDLQSRDKREKFILDLWRGTLRLSKAKYQNRGRKAIVLVRLDFGGSGPHTNPDGAVIGPDHIHIYKEEYEDRWAYPVDPKEFRNLKDFGNALADFCSYCHIINVPPIQAGLL